MATGSVARVPDKFAGARSDVHIHQLFELGTEEIGTVQVVCLEIGSAIPTYISGKFIGQEKLPFSVRGRDRRELRYLKRGCGAEGNYCEEGEGILRLLNFYKGIDSTGCRFAWEAETGI